MGGNADLESGLKTQLLASFTDADGKPLQKSVRPVMLHFDEETYLTRFEKVRGFAYNLSETMYTITPSVLEMPFRKLKAFPGSNRKNVLGPIAFQPYTAEHHNLVQWSEKKNIWSPAAKLACRVGGVGEEGTTRSKERSPETVEPVCFHAYSREVWSEILHMHSAVGFLDFTVGSGYAAEACIIAGIPYVGFVQTEVHETVTRRYLFGRMWELMQKPGNTHYEPDLPSVLSGKPGGGSNGGGAPGDPPSPVSEDGGDGGGRAGGGAPEPAGGGAPAKGKAPRRSAGSGGEPPKKKNKAGKKGKANPVMEAIKALRDKGGEKDGDGTDDSAADESASDPEK